MKRLAAHIRRRRAGHAEFEQHLAVFEAAFAHEMAAIVGQIDRIVGTHMDAVGARILAFAPRAQKIALAVEDHHRMLATGEAVDIVVFVDADRSDLLERPALGQLGPVLDDAVAILAASDDRSHRRLPLLIPLRNYRRPGGSATAPAPMPCRNALTGAALHRTLAPGRQQKRRHRPVMYSYI